MKYYAKNIVSAEQFTDDFTPEGVIKAPEIFIENVLVESIKKSIDRDNMFLLKLSNPGEMKEELKKLFKVPYAFEWIKKGDYVVTFANKRNFVESKKDFEDNYTEVQF